MTDLFQRRHIGPAETDVQLMLQRIGVSTLDELMDQVVPAGIRDDTPPRLPPALSEKQALQELQRLGQMNTVVQSMIGQGYFGTILPAVIQRNVLENPAWYTAYTPYQPEISQGRLEVLFNFQTLVAELTGLPIANASMLDEATAVAEAMTMCYRAHRGKKRTVLVSAQCYAQTLDVIRTRAEPLDINIVLISDAESVQFTGDECAVILQSPDTDGVIRNYGAMAEAAHERGVMVVLATDLLALTMVKCPADMGVDIAVGSAQRFGVPMGFGGPHAAFFATTEKYKRNIPGRLVGLSVDAIGKPAYRLALQTREQHIRREKATSNICTAQALLAIIATLYAQYHGPQGLKRIATRVHRMLTVLVDRLCAAGFELSAADRFDTVAIPVAHATDMMALAEQQGINLRLIDDHTVGVSLDETTTLDCLNTVLTVLTGTDAELIDEQTLERMPLSIASSLQRNAAFLTQPAFNNYHSETQMMRYMQTLADRDLALNRAMIPLGSCTMKLNAAAENGGSNLACI